MTGQASTNASCKPRASANRSRPSPKKATIPTASSSSKPALPGVSQKFGNGHRTLNYLGAGHIYGLQEIAHNWRKPESPVSLQYTLRVMGYTHVIKIPTDVMETIVLPEIDAAAFARAHHPRGRPPNRAYRGVGCRRKNRRGHAGIPHRKPLLQRHGHDDD